MAGHTPTSADAIIEVQSWINTLGVRNAFKITGRLLLYSGPRKSIRDAFPAYDRNHGRAFAKATAKRRRHTIIDQTEVGQRLGRYDGVNNIYMFFEKIYGSAVDAAGNPIYEKHGNAVMAYASEVLMQAAKGDVETLACSADLNGVFYRFELPALLKNPKVTSINGVNADKLRGIYFSGRPTAAYETFRKVCQGELALARKRMMAAKSKSAKAAMRDEYEMGRAFFVMERHETITGMVAVPAAVTVASPSHSAIAPTIPPAYMLGRSHPRLGIGTHVH